MPAARPPRPIPVIPVLDLRHGRVVRAVRGERAHYAPVESSLVAGSDPVAVAEALRACTGQDRLYVADLDAILEGVVQFEVVAALLQADPARCVWLDAGVHGPEDLAALRTRLGALSGRVRPVLGSESLASLDGLAAMAADPNSILSLDGHLQQPLDPAGIWQHPSLWPDTLIAMTLDRVGTGSGPDLQRFAQLRSRKPGATWVGAGGLRDAADLDRARAAGAAAWLVASALHEGRLRPMESTA